MNPIPTNLEDPASPPPPQRIEDGTAEMPVWLQRLFVVVYVLFCIELGLALIVLPWSGYWFNDGWLQEWPYVRSLIQSGFVRGAVSGLGLLDICLGVLEAVNYRDRR